MKTETKIDIWMRLPTVAYAYLARNLDFYFYSAFLGFWSILYLQLINLDRNPYTNGF